MPTVGGIRVSTDAQAEKYGPDRQRSDIEREAARAGLEITSWVEEAISGANDERAAENTYYQLAREHEGLNVIFSHPNRVGRHVEVTVGIARRIHKLGGTVWIAGIGSLRDRRNWKEFLRDAVDAENDYSNLIHNMGTGRQDKARRGHWPHGSPPWGYVLERDHRGVATLPAIVPELAAAVQRLFELGELQGESETLRTMRAEGWPAPTAAGWTKKSVHNLLTNSNYTGVREFQGIRIEYPAIITPEVFERVQARRAVRRTHTGTRGAALLFSGHLRCAECGTSMGRDVDQSRYLKKDGTVSLYAAYEHYRCWRAKGRDLQTRPCGHTKRWPAALVHQQGWAYLSEHLQDPKRLATIAAPLERPEAGLPAGRVAELEAAIERAWKPFAEGRPGYSEAMAERIAAPYVLELERLRAALETRTAPASPDFERRAAEFRELLSGELSFEDRRKLLYSLDVVLYWGPQGVAGLQVSVP